MPACFAPVKVVRAKWGPTGSVEREIRGKSCRACEARKHCSFHNRNIHNQDGKKRGYRQIHDGARFHLGGVASTGSSFLTRLCVGPASLSSVVTTVTSAVGAA
jgi:hypothetical protein